MDCDLSNAVTVNSYNFFMYTKAGLDDSRELLLVFTGICFALRLITGFELRGR